MVGTRTSNLLRRITIPLIICCLVTVSLRVQTAAALPGSGTQQDPWRIQSLADFDEFAADPNYWSGFTRLETDVNLAGRFYDTTVIAPDTNISTGGFQGTAFTGTFDGNKHKIIGPIINGLDYAGLFGFMYSGEVKNLGIENVSVCGRDFVGGLVGQNGDLYHPNGAISNCYFTGGVSGTDRTGGLVGYNWGDISNCYSTGFVIGGMYVGGLVGWNEGSILNCYSTCYVGADYIGGLCGANWGSVSNCYSNGIVLGNVCVGGLTGIGSGEGGKAVNCFWDIETSGLNTSDGGIGKTTTEMQTRSTFTDAGWDFVEIWFINNGAMYPALRQEIHGDLNGDASVGFADLAILANNWLKGTAP